jgi:hypothetical protein
MKSTSSTSSKKSPNDFLVQGLDEIEPAFKQFPGLMYAGTMPMDSGDRHGNTMFWLFEPTKQNVPDSIVIWLNGGPGCSSFNCGVMMEHSPVTQPLHPAGYCCLVDSTPALHYNEHTWTKATAMLYIEHPIGTGFSRGHPNPENEMEASGDLDVFLQNFFEVFEHLRHYDFYIMGESYAGMFIPSVARYIQAENEKALGDSSSSRHIVHLKGVAIGNGWMDGMVQGPATIDYSWYHGLIDKPTRDSLHIEVKNCMENFGKPNDLEPHPFHPFNVQDDCGIMWGVLAAAGNPNAYDVTTWDPNVDQVTFSSEAFYNTPTVRKILHAPENVTWHGCQWGEGRRRLNGDHEHRKLYMDNDRPLSVVPYVADLLDSGIPILFYNGDRDMTTNMVGTELLLNAMEWSGKDEWTNAKRGLWMVDKHPAGWAKEYENLSFVVVYNSGHMVPYNQPVPAFDLLTRFLQHESFLDVESPTLRVVEQVVTTEVTTSFNDIARHGGSLWETTLVAAVSMLAGVLFTLFFVRVRKGARSNYQRVPDAEISL